MGASVKDVGQREGSPCSAQPWVRGKWSAPDGVKTGALRRATRRAEGLCAGFSKPLVKPSRPPPTAADVEPFYTVVDRVLQDPKVLFVQLQDAESPSAVELLEQTPLPDGASSFSSMHLAVAPGARAARLADGLSSSGEALIRTHRYQWPATASAAAEYEALFEIASQIILDGADRASLLVFVAGPESETGLTSSEQLAIASLLGMLPFRGIQAAIVQGGSAELPADPFQVLRTPSGLFEYSSGQPARLGRPPLAAVFSSQPSRTLTQPLAPWEPVHVTASESERLIPFKIGGLKLPMVAHEGRYEDGITRLVQVLEAFCRPNTFPVVAVGQTCDALGYGADIFAALTRDRDGYYFVHPSGESEKRPEAYGRPELLEALAAAKRRGAEIIIIAVGGGVNGNAMGMLAALTSSVFIEVPTTLMHFNDATTSAKKAFSLIHNRQILSKNILGTFYLPHLVYCICEVFLTLSPCSIHAAVGEAAKTMALLGRANSKAGHRDFHNILGANEFASDFSKVMHTVPGFEQLLHFLEQTLPQKTEALETGLLLRAACGQETASLAQKRRGLLAAVRGAFHSELLPEQRREVMQFLLVINSEVISAKAMFLAYSDPFEKKRALLFEYAHTLGHAVEAFMNGLYLQAEAAGVDFSHAFRLHGQCVGMAVGWAGEMSREMGILQDKGYLAHQGLVALFNTFGGFDFLPLRHLCDQLQIGQEDFCEGVLRVVRRDNKRGYCKCGPGASVDQLIHQRPGLLVQSEDPAAALRYLVEVSEEAQRSVLKRAFNGEFDRVLVTDCSADSGLALQPRAAFRAAAPGSSRATAAALDALLQELYSVDS